MPGPEIPAPVGRPNVLLIMCDQLRGDCLGFAGHPDVKTPYLDSLAAQSTFFERAYSACPTCLPARVSLFTGQTPAHHGRVGYEDGVSWDFPHMLPQVFSDAGYQTACAGKLHVHPPRLACGFQTLRLHDGYLGCYQGVDIPYWMHQDVHDDYLRFLRRELGPDADVDSTGPECNSWVYHPWIYEERLHPTNWVADETIRLLETRDRTRPFFLMASFVRPHPPLDAPASYYERYERRELREPARGDWDDLAATERDGMVPNSVHGCRDATLRHEAMAGYYAAVTHVDHQVGRLISALKRDGSFNDTIIVFLADHGEMLFDHSLWRKLLPYEGSARIPLFFRVGTHLAKAPAHRSQSVVELMDVMPTLLDLCGIEAPEGVDGSSLAGDILRAEELERPYVHGEHAFTPEQSHHYIVTPRDKYVWFSQTGREQYFDLSEDRSEAHDLIDEPAYRERVAQMRAWLVSELEGREEGFVESGHLIAGRPLVNVLERPLA
ncbi:MAG: arylsulfatase [Coriobacteriaceae bacterium]|uniref:arylsulfatase n=1 Tax=Tractidigestivibacter sp. TaxID=2847320 RepID=UPI002A90B7FE|nr:arylsulfatase [Tractidigestivibacter sp.]MCI6843737.1 arylsulfatase [Coriobacteriaceae bacterium]MDD7584320.1 arylsulfatase [Coriobacteriaceae bacterium]MDY5272319.1 arylsulfatase [Tractidigestivibacter sp.]